MEKMKDKLGSFEVAYDNKWDVLMEIWLEEFQSKKPAGTLANEQAGFDWFKADLHIDSDSDAEETLADIETCNGDESSTDEADNCVPV